MHVFQSVTLFRQACDTARSATIKHFYVQDTRNGVTISRVPDPHQHLHSTLKLSHAVFVCVFSHNLIHFLGRVVFSFSEVINTQPVQKHFPAVQLLVSVSGDFLFAPLLCNVRAQNYKRFHMLSCVHRHWLRLVLTKDRNLLHQLVWSALQLAINEHCRKSKAYLVNRSFSSRSWACAKYALGSATGLMYFTVAS